MGAAEEVRPAGVALAGDAVDVDGVGVAMVVPPVGEADVPVGLGVVGVGVVGVGVREVLGVGLGVTCGAVVLGAGAGVVCVGDGVALVCDGDGVGVTVGVALSEGEEFGEGNPDGM